jgi:hypothetical protein
MSGRLRLRGVAAAGALVLLASHSAAVQRSREDGNRLERKINEIAANGAARNTRAKTTAVSESELNSYLGFNVRDQMPRGLAEPEITMIGGGSLAGRVLVDIDEFKRGRDSQDFMDPLNYLSGRVPVTARGTLRSQNGRAQFQLVSAELLGVPLPQQLVQELVSFFSRTAENPRGFALDAPFDLPAKIRRIDVTRGEALVAQ